MAKLTIVTNNRARNTLYWNELTAKEQSEFDWIEPEQREFTSDFVRYRGEVYKLSEFQSCPIEMTSNEGPMKGWEGYSADSYFSGILIRFADSDCEQVIMGSYYS
jgi:hypothetical protein